MRAGTMRPLDVALAVIDACEEHEEVGRTSLQKVAYFVGVSLDIDLGHEAHLYGPYSRLLEREIGALVFAEAVTEDRMRLGVAGDFGERTQYRYTLTDVGRKHLAKLEAEHPEEMRRIQDVVSAVRDVAGHLGQGKLAPAAKTFYLVARQGRVSGFSEVQELAREYGWHLSSDQEDGILSLLLKLGLIEETAEDTED